jgi:5-methylcytosine-specific restriction endonuclease McrA
MIQRRKPLPRGNPPKRTSYLPRSSKPIPKVNAAASARRRAAYRKYLASATWKRIRAQKLGESPECEMQHAGCLLTEQLTVHHTTYARFGGDELMSDLQTACRPCHNHHEALKGKRIHG